TSMWAVVDKKAGDGENPEYRDCLEDVQRAGKLLANPLKGLKDTDSENRFLTAALLLARYRNAHPGARQVEIPAEESKLILTALAEANWKEQNWRLGSLMPQPTFLRLGLTDKDGWKLTGGDFSSAAKEWLRTHGAKYRIKRFTIPSKNEAEPD